MSRPTRRQVLHGSAAALAGAALAAPVALADTAVARPVGDHGHPTGDGNPGSTGSNGHPGGHEMPEPFNEMYQGRHIEGWPADEQTPEHASQGSSGRRTDASAGPHDGMDMDFVVRIDNDDLHVMRNADGTWISLVNHYETFTTPHTLARAAVRELQGAELVPVVTG
ncbi:apotyrosinase chaperone MelC1 [Streptomyces lydicus]